MTPVPTLRPVLAWARRVDRLPQRHRQWLLDAGLVAVFVLMLTTDMTVLFFHLVFVLLTLAAFFLPLRAFAWRCGLWVTATTLVVLRAIALGDTQAEEAIEIPLLTTIVALVFVIASRRERARADLEAFRSMIRNASDVIIVAGHDGRVRYASPSVERVFGYAPSDVQGRFLDELLPAEDRDRVRDAAAPNDGAPVVAEHAIRSANGEVRLAETTFTNLAADPTVQGTILNTRDVTVRRRLEQQLERLAYYDALTGLANRALFNDRLEHASSRARRSGEHLAVLFMDLDGFKQVNDRYGHEVGDRLLAETARRIRGQLRDSDTIARLGGDEFAVLLEGAAAVGAARTAERITEAVRQPFAVEGHSLTAGVSIGIASSVGLDAGDLLRDADIAMYRAKALGKGRSEIFDRSIRQRLADVHIA